MSFGGGRPPAPPDPFRTTMQQQQFAQDAARQNAALNRINQQTPFGRLVYRQVAPAAAWDEEAYLAANPDVRGSGMSGREHWERFGRMEGRGGVPANFGAGAQYESVVELTPEEQRILDLGQQARTQLGELAAQRASALGAMLNQPMPGEGLALGRVNLGGVNLAGVNLDRVNLDRVNLMQRPDFTGIGDPNQARDAVEGALMARLAPQLDRERNSLEARLANQGITMGSEAWQRGFDDFGRLSNDARLAAIAQAGQEQSRIFNLGLQQAAFNNEAALAGTGFNNQAALAGTGFNNEAALAGTGFNNQAALTGAAFNNQAALAGAGFNNQAALSEAQLAMQRRQQAIGEIQALQGQSAPQMPQFINAPQVSVATPDFMAAVQNDYLARLQAFQNQQQQRAATLGALSQLGGAALGAAFGGPMGAAIGRSFGGMFGSRTPTLEQMSRPGWFTNN